MLVRTAKDEILEVKTFVGQDLKASFLLVMSNKTQKESLEHNLHSSQCQSIMLKFLN